MSTTRRGSRSPSPKLAIASDVATREFRIPLDQYRMLDQALLAVERAQEQANLIFAVLAKGLLLEGGDLVSRRETKTEGVLVMRNVEHKRKGKGR
jgi:hypothetical protein